MEVLPPTSTPVRPWERTALAGLLVLTAGLLAFLAWRTGVTNDEPGHLVGANLYWEAADRLPPGDMPPLIKLVGGWAPRMIDLPLPGDLGRPGDTRREWEVSLAMMEHLRHDRIGRIFFYSRLPLMVFPLLTVWIVWLWARELFSPVTAIAAAGLFALEPTALAHGALFKNDLAATFAYFLFWFAIWRYWRNPSIRGAALVAVATALCMIAKLSLLFVFGVAPLLIVLRGPLRPMCGHGPFDCGTESPAQAESLPHPRRHAIIRYFGVALGVCAAAYVLVLAAAQFDVRWLGAGDLVRLDADRTIPAWFQIAARAFTVFPVPARMWAGTYALMSGFAYENPVYLYGRIWPHGHPLYFLAALLVKAPVTLIAFGGIGAGLLLTALVKRRLTWSDAFWTAPGALYIFLCSRVPVQLGVRLILPALPFGVLLCAFAVEWMRKRRAGRIVVGAGLALFAFETARIYPHGIAFFNLAAGGPGAGIRYLVDSNLDWGQGLGDLQRWARAHGAGPVRLSYFGSDMMYRYFRGNEVEPIPPPWADSLAKGRTQLVPEPGHYYAISPTLLPGHFFAPKYRDYYAAFRAMTPVARPGYSIFVYRVDPPGH
jgi:hypothetical protein